MSFLEFLSFHRRSVPFRSVFPRTNRLLQALAGSRKSCREWGLFAPLPRLDFLRSFFSRAPHPPRGELVFFGVVLCACAELANKPAPPQSAASGPGRSLFGVASDSVWCQSLLGLLLTVGRYFARQYSVRIRSLSCPAKTLTRHPRHASVLTRPCGKSAPNSPLRR